MPDSLEVTARHFLWDEPSQSSTKTFPPPAVHALSRENGTAERPQALRCPKLKNHFSAEDAQSKAAGILNRLSPAIAAQRHIIARRRHFSGVENCNFPRLFHTEKRQRPGVENLGASHSRLEKNKSPLRNGL